MLSQAKNTTAEEGNTQKLYWITHGEPTVCIIQRQGTYRIHTILVLAIPQLNQPGLGNSPLVVMLNWVLFHTMELKTFLQNFGTAVNGY